MTRVCRLAAALVALLAVAPAVGDEARPRGLLWGRITVEEESPEGPWTPLVGVEVRLYPYAPALVGDLEGIRQGARNSGAAYDTAVAEMQNRLQAYAAELLTGAVHHVTTDGAGVFVFEDLPPGEWLLVAFRVTPYRPTQARPQAKTGKRRPTGGDATFLPQTAAQPAKEVEIWVTPVRIGPGDRARLALTDRGHFLVGPYR